jgi:hypothetical protein
MRNLTGNTFKIFKMEEDNYEIEERIRKLERRFARLERFVYRMGLKEYIEKPDMEIDVSVNDDVEWSDI